MPSYLILGKAIDNKYIHIVLSRSEDFIYLITAYYPDPTQWEADLKARNVPCYKCTECNEVIYTADVMKQLENIAEQAKCDFVESSECMVLNLG